MMATIYDAISNGQVARCKVLKADDKSIVLSNANGEANALMNVSKKFRMQTDDEAYIGAIKPVRASKRYMTVLIDGYGKKDRRRYLRLPCKLFGSVYSLGTLSECTITELAYASCIINTPEELIAEEEATIQFSTRIADLAINGVVKFQQEGEQDDGIWFSGYNYMVSFDSNNLVTTLDQLYAFIQTMLREEAMQ